jgi:DNA-binding MurR/RpiR family transcriptional regulator
MEEQSEQLFVCDNQSNALRKLANFCLSCEEFKQEFNRYYYEHSFSSRYLFIMCYTVITNRFLRKLYIFFN